MVTEHIADKSKTPLYVSLVFIVLCVALLAFSVYEMLNDSDIFALYLFIAVVCILGLIIFTIVLIKWLRVPEHIITKVGDRLYFDAADFTADEIEYVNYRRANLLYRHSEMVIFNYGTLTVALTDGRKISCNYVEDVEQVNSILFTLAKIAERNAVSSSQ